MKQCQCQFIPGDILERLAQDAKLSREVLEHMRYSVWLSKRLREVRQRSKEFTGSLLEANSLTTLTQAPEVTVFDCKQTLSLPGIQIKEPGTSSDPSVKRTHSETTHVARFLREVFDRNSIDNAGVSMMSSVHYGKKFNNAMWNGMQMIYGDGDDKLFVDFTLGNDVIGHELAHGITQYTLQLDYDGEPGGLNESFSDCFGSMFRQWRAGHDAHQADWLIGKDILGSTSLERGYTCLRDMADPAARHCLAPQPAHYKDVKRGMDPHYSSGPINLAFCTACKQVGGHSWETVGKVWYHVMTRSGLRPRMPMADFAALTLEASVTLFGKESNVEAAIKGGWQQVGL